MKIEEIIKRYDELKRELAMLEVQISSFKGISDTDMIEAMTYSHPEGERVVTSGVSDKTAKIAMTYANRQARENDAMYDFLIDRRNKVKEEIEFFETVINNSSHKDIAKALFIEKMSWCDVERFFNVSHSALGRYRKQIIEEIEYNYTLQMSLVESYLLS